MLNNVEWFFQLRNYKWYRKSKGGVWVRVFYRQGFCFEYITWDRIKDYDKSPVMTKKIIETEDYRSWVKEEVY